MKFPSNFNLKPAKIFKIAGLVILAIIVVILAFRLIGSSFKSISQSNAPSYDYAGQSLIVRNYESAGEDEMGAAKLSATPGYAPSYYGNTGTTGDEAEEFEVTEYNANIETRHLENTCGAVAVLKSRPDVIFENASEYDHGCNYVFKVKKDKANEILAIIKDLNPKDLSENTYTIKKAVDYLTNETEILEKKLASIDETLKKAVSAYDDVSALATRVQDVGSLAKIIDSKINIIERLTQERLNINSQLEKIAQSKADQLDRLEYTYFRISILENKFIDGQSLKDSWKASIKEFVQDINKIAQDVTVNLVALLFLILEYLLYFFIILVIIKYVWRLAKHVWQK